MAKRVVFDFDGVIHSYISGWRGVAEIPDAPNEDAVKAIDDLRDLGYEVVIVSTRCQNPRGLAAIVEWLKKYEIEVDLVTSHKPPAICYIDDRAICYTPGVNLVEEVKNFKTWHQRHIEVESDGTKETVSDLQQRIDRA